MKKLPLVHENNVKCTTCVSTNQMKSSECCTSFAVKSNGQFIPECFVNISNISQAQRNFLTCPTYNLGMYEICNTCPLECPKNTSLKSKSPIFDIINLLGSMFGIDESKKKEFDKSLNKLNQPEFKEVYTSLERASGALKAVLDSKTNSDVTKKILEVETNHLKNAFDNLIKNGKITAEEARLLNTEVNSSTNIQKLKSMLETMRNQHREKA